jgi:prefoldin subunit 5
MFVAGAQAQDDERQDFKMPCGQVTRLGLEKFMKVYGDKTQDYSTAGQKMGFEYYVKCKRPANDDLATKLLHPGNSLGSYEALRIQIDDVREQLNKYGAALWTLRYAEEGGGTMWGLISVGAYAGREDFMETLIRTLALSYRKSPLARKRVTASLARIQSWLTSPKRKPFTENSDPNDVVSSKKLYQDTIKEAQAALTELRTILNDLPDAAADRLAARMAEETKDALADSP